MAALQKIRSKGVLLVTVIAVALFLFVLGDALRGGESFLNQQKQQIGEIDGENVSIQEYQETVDELKLVYELMYQTSSFSADELNRINDEAWQSIVTNALIKKECDELGITATDEEIADVIRSGASQLLQVPYFMNQQTGRYDYTILQSFLAEYKKLKDAKQQIPEAYEKIYNYYLYAQKTVRNQIMIGKYQALFAKCVMSNPVEAEMSFNGRANESKVLLASIPFSTVDDSKVTVKEDEITAKYNEDKEKYLQPIESRDIKVIDIPVVASAEDKKATEKDMNSIYEKLLTSDNKSAASIVRTSSSKTTYTDVMKKADAYPQFIAQHLDSTSAGQTFKPKYDITTNMYYTFKVLEKSTMADSILYRNMAVVQSDPSKVNATADSILNAIKGGAAFKSIAKKYNQTGDSAWIATKDFQNSALDANNITIINTVYSMSKGETKKVSLSNGAVIILQVLDTKNFVTKYNVASVVKELKFSDDTYSKVYNKFSSFVASNPTADKINANAEKEGYHIQTLTDVTSNGHTIANVQNTRDALKWVFDEAKPNDVSQLYECGNNDHLMLVILSGVNKKGYRPLDKVKEEIASELRNDKKAEVIMADLKGVNTLDKAKSKAGARIDTISRISFANPTFVMATNASEPIVSAVASKTAKGAVSAPFKGNNGVYMLKVVDQAKTSEKYDAKTEERTSASTNARMAFNSFLDDLYLKADVKDTRYKFF